MTNNSIPATTVASDTAHAAGSSEEKRTESQNKSAHRAIPIRKGSKYTDILLQRLRAEPLRDISSPIIGVVSFSPRQGVTTTALNLAIRAADHEISPVLMVDANHQNQKASRQYRAHGVGLSECLNGQASLDKSVKTSKVPGMNVLGLGQAKLARQMVMATDATADLFDLIREQYRFTVVDLPAFKEPSIAHAVMPYLDGVVMVAKYGSKKEQLATLQREIRVHGGQVIGSVMTGSESKLPRWLSRFF